MPSYLRNQTHFTSISAHITASSYPHSTSPPPAKRQRKMSVTETYRLVHSARGKLTREAQRSEHDLRLLVGHANLLDSLMVELEHAEYQHSTWGTAPKQKTWAATTTVVEEAEDDEDSGSDYDDDEMDMVPSRSHGVPEYRPQFHINAEDSDSDDAVTDSGSDEEEEEEEEEEDDEDISDDEDSLNLGLALCRTNSRTGHDTRASSPPDLVNDSDDSDDDSPSSPPTATINYVSQQSKDFPHIISTVHSKEPCPEDALYEDGFYIPQSAPLLATC